MQRTHKYRSNGKKKRENSVKFDDEMQEVKIISSQAKTYPKEKRKKNQKKKLKSEPESADTYDDIRTYDIYHLNLGKLANELDSESE